MRTAAKIALSILIVAVLLAGGLGAWDFSRFLHAPLTLQSPQLIQISPGTNMTALAGQLAAQGLLAHPRYAHYLDWYARATGEARHLKAGEYQVEPGMQPPDLLQRITSGKVYQHRLTVVEGWTFDQMMRAIDRNDAIKHTLRGDSGAEIMKAIGQAGKDPEGLFAPDTYFFPRGTTDVQFLQRAYRKMQRTLHDAWENRDDDLPFQTSYQALILASIIERETGVASERRRIAGVFVRRLERGMRLQADPTVIYGLGSTYDGNLSLRDLRRDTLYNTHTRRGLPPTPICIPSAASIKAAVHPAQGDALYFVSRGDGTHHFSATLEEHNRAVARYQLGKGN